MKNPKRNLFDISVVPPGQKWDQMETKWSPTYFTLRKDPGYFTRVSVVLKDFNSQTKHNPKW